MSDLDEDGSAAEELQAEEEVRQLKQSVRALKGHLTRWIRSVEKAVQGEGSAPTSHTIRELLDFQRAIQG